MSRYQGWKSYPSRLPESSLFPTEKAAAKKKQERDRTPPATNTNNKDRRGQGRPGGKGECKGGFIHWYGRGQGRA